MSPVEREALRANTGSLTPLRQAYSRPLARMLPSLDVRPLSVGLRRAQPPHPTPPPNCRSKRNSVRGNASSNRTRPDSDSLRQRHSCPTEPFEAICTLRERDRGGGTSDLSVPIPVLLITHDGTRRGPLIQWARDRPLGKPARRTQQTGPEHCPPKGGVIA